MAQVNEASKVTPGLGEPSLECTHAESEKVEEEAANREDVDRDLDDVEPEEMVEKEAFKRVDEIAARNVDASREEEQVSKQAGVIGGDAVEHLAEGRGALDSLHLVEDVVEMDTAAEEGDPESEEEASEQDEDEECEAEEGATSDQENVEDDEEDNVDEGENGEEVEENEEEDDAHRTVDVEQAEREMPPPGEHRFLDSTARRAMRSSF